MNILKGNCQNKKLTFSNGSSLNINTNFKGEVNVGMRPEDFKIDNNGSINLNVELVELIGSNTLIHGKLSKSNEILVASIPGVIKENLKGKDLNLSFDESKIHLFDVNSDQRIN
jgi:sn-glycerol 3-phosphate transport system ATP-binding protein